MKAMIWKVKYYLLRLRGIDWNGFYNAVNYAHRKSGKSKLTIFIDMICCSFRYTAGYVDYNEFEFYLLNNMERSTYLTLGHSHKVTKVFNNNEESKIFENKEVFNKFFKGYVNRGFLDLRESTVNELENFVKKYGKVMAKRSCDYVGRGINTLEAKTISDYEKLYENLLSNNQPLIEEFVSQHDTMNLLSKNSVNTMRVITFVDDNKEPQILVVALKSGLGAEVDNIGQGGMYTILNEEGIVDMPFIDKYGNHHSVHPISGLNLIGFKVPNYKELIHQVKQACLVLPNVRYVGWDIAVTPEENIEIIEGNTTSGPFQKIPSLSQDRIGILPVYKKHIPMKF